MHFVANSLFKLMFGLSVISIVVSRPPLSLTSYFPSPPHPWSDNSEKLKTFEDDWSPYLDSDGFDSRNEVLPRFPIYSRGQHGFVPSDITPLDSVYWWKKRFQNTRTAPIEDLPFYDEIGDENSIDDYITGSVNKRDYTAAQLVNMLKAIAKARRHKNVRIAGKALRFGISK